MFWTRKKAKAVTTIEAAQNDAVLRYFLSTKARTTQVADKVTVQIPNVSKTVRTFSDMGAL